MLITTYLMVEYFQRYSCHFYIPAMAKKHFAIAWSQVELYQGGYSFFSGHHSSISWVVLSFHLLQEVTYPLLI